MAEVIAATSTPTEDAKVIRRKVYDAIEAVYDEKRKCYSVGLKGYHTDESIAKSIGCAEQLVTKVREEFFGPGEPDEPTEDIKKFQMIIAHLDKEADENEAVIDGMKEQVSKLRKGIDAARKQLKEMCQANGWYH